VDGVYELTSSNYLGPHGIAIIGYDDSLSAWIIKNSWGQGWGQDGIGYVKYGTASVGNYSAEPVVNSACPGCLIDSRCWMAGQVNDLNACQICKPSLAAEAWTQLADGEPCDDGDSCNGADTCGGGTCSLHTGDPCVDDGVFCNGVEFCNPNTGTCSSSGSPCGIGEECNEDSQECGPGDDRSGEAADDGGGGCGG
jgi:hypothetical protein